MVVKAEDGIRTVHESFSLGTAGRHETFAPRYGWLPKGYDRCRRNNHVFNDPTAIEQLGVGKNMVRSIRYWCLLFRLLEDAGTPGCLRPTAFGTNLLDPKTGWDPYLEDPASLWLLHWQIFRPPFMAVSWNLAFSFTTISAFRTSELANSIVMEAQGFDKLRSIATSSFEKDASCILRMYGTSVSDQVHVRSPFAELGIIVPAIERDQEGCLRFALGQKPTLPDLIFMGAVFDYAAQWLGHQKSIALGEIVFHPNSPGMAFRLSESDCGQRVDRACRCLNGVEFTETNGIRQLQFDGAAEDLATECLARYYESKR